MAKRRRARCVLGDGHESARPARYAPPTDAVPGSPAKVEELARRYARRQALFGPGDLIDEEGLRLNLVRRGNNFHVVDEDCPVIDEREKCREKKLRKCAGASPGDRLRQAREFAGLTLRQLAAACGTHHYVLSRIESRSVAPPLLTLCRVSRALGVCPDWLACL